LRRLARPRRPGDGAQGYRFRLAYRPPYDWDAILAFLRARAIPGVESADDGTYRRTIAVDGVAGAIEVRHAEAGTALELVVRFPNPRALLHIVGRVRRIFDLGADPAAIGAHLGADPLLRRPLKKHPGIRTPGAWDGFELAVRAILGQQISVRAASTIAGRIASRFGTAGAEPEGGDRLFPSPARLAHADIESTGVIRARAEAIRSLARETAANRIIFSPGVDVETAVMPLKALRGVGDWTAQYIAMRAFAEPDAFPSGDLVLRRATGARTARQLERRADAWRPWRAYAVMLLWQKAEDDREHVVSRNR
jgi:AraC family transcriptional regulator of adaptative response / DNA-3-methyladenine glycosylase II